jgi:hypothetical protein
MTETDTCLSSRASGFIDFHSKFILLNRFCTVGMNYSMSFEAIYILQSTAASHTWQMVVDATFYSHFTNSGF